MNHLEEQLCKRGKLFVIFGKFKKRNPRAVGFFRQILDRNVVVFPCECVMENIKSNAKNLKYNYTCLHS